MGAIDLIKRHPVASSVGAIVIFGGVILVMNSGGQEISSGGPVSDVQAGTDLQSMQQAFQLQMGAINAQIQNSAGEREAAITLAQIDTQSKKDLALLSVDLERERINADKQTAALVSTLAAQVQTKSINAEVAKENINAGIINNQTKALVSINQMMQQTQQKAIKKQCSGFFSCLF